MKITSIDLREIAAETPTYSGSSYKIAARRALLCRIGTDEGVTAEVCVGNDSTYTATTKTAIRETFRALLIGGDPLCTTAHWQAMFAHCRTNVDRASMMKALATVDIALWDLKGRLSGLPVYKLIGGARARVPMIAIGGYYETAGDEKGVRDEIARLKARQIGGIKLKVGGRSVEEDADRVRIAREAGGPDFAIVANSNKAWSVDDSVRFAHMIERYRPEWLEEPVYWQNMHKGLRDVRVRSGMAIGAGQSEVSVFDCYGLIASEAVDILNVTANRGGGITAWLQIAGAAAAAGVRMGQVAEPQFGMHIMAGITNPTFAECYAEPERDPFWEVLYKTKPAIEDGMIVLPDGPGLGLELNPEMVERYAIEDWS